MTERCVSFRIDGSTVLGILHEPETRSTNCGIVVVVGGPQYRVGSHRLFVRLARDLAEAGFPVFRFDLRGMGDSEGAFRGFENSERDIQVAIDAFIQHVAAMRRVVLFGLCDGASAALLYAHSDDRISGLILANPWVHTESGNAKVYLKHYYWKRLGQASFWRKFLSGRINVAASLGDFANKLGRSVRHGSHAGVAFVDRMLHGVQSVKRPMLFLISERDLTAQQFDQLCEQDLAWKRAVSADLVRVVRLPGADHTFSSAADTGRVARHCVEWLGASADR